MTQKKYSAGLMSQSFWFIEFKKVLPMVMEGKAQDEIKKYCIEQNIFGAVNANRSRRVTNYITNSYYENRQAFIRVRVRSVPHQENTWIQRDNRC